MSSITGIYKIISPSGRIYIGQAVDIKRRFKEYKNIKKSKLQPKLNRSFNKYGIEEHTFEIIEETILENLNNRERYWQDYYNVLSKKGLNCVLVKSDDKSGFLNEEIKLKISLANTGNFHNEETRAKMGIKNLGKIATLETRQKMSNSRKGKKLSKNWCENISNGNLNKNKSEKHKLKLSKIKKELYSNSINHPRSKKVINTNTGEIYNSIKDAAKSILIKEGTLYNWLNNKYPNKSPLVFVTNYKSDSYEI